MAEKPDRILKSGTLEERVKRVEERQDVYERLGGNAPSPAGPPPEDLLWSFSTRRRSRQGPAPVLPPD